MGSSRGWTKENGTTMTERRKLILNLFEMNTVSHVSHGLWPLRTGAGGSSTASHGGPASVI
jgi:hypothetical protein